MNRLLVFRSNWPNEWEFDADENPVVPGAHELAEHIAAGAAKSERCTTEVIQHSYYGWAFITHYNGATFSQVLGTADEMYLTVTYDWYLRDRLLWRRPKSRFDRYISLLKVVLEGTEGVSEVREEPV